MGFFLAYPCDARFWRTWSLPFIDRLHPASLAITYSREEKRIAAMPLVSGIAVTLLGGLTLWLHDDYFIKIKPTLVNLLFAAILLGGLAFRKSLFKYVLGHAMQLDRRRLAQIIAALGIVFYFSCCA